MLHVLLLLAASVSGPPNLNELADLKVRRNKNGEFIFRKYPPRALAAGEQGAVRFRVEADKKGNVLGCQVTASSGFPRLDAETCELVINHASFAPVVDSGGKARAAVHDGVVNWRIPGATAVSAGKVASNAAVPAKIICHRTERTGSLIAHSRLCMTEREWARNSDRAQDELGDLQGRQGWGVCPIDAATKEPLC
jgi:TonB family protein